MHKLLITAGLFACLGVAGCQQSSSQASEAPAAAPKKSLARQAAFYDGQEQVLAVQSGAVSIGADGQLVMKAEAATGAPGYVKPTFVKRIYAAPPPDGIYEMDVVAQKPTQPGAQVVTPIQVKGEWPQYPTARVKGIRFIAQTNEVVAMLPTTSSGASGAD